MTVWYHLVLSWCTMFSEVTRRGVHESNNIDFDKQHHTPHCWLPAKVMHPANSTKRFSWLTRSTSILLMRNVQIYECYQAQLPIQQRTHKKNEWMRDKIGVISLLYVDQKYGFLQPKNYFSLFSCKRDLMENTR